MRRQRKSGRLLRWSSRTISLWDVGWVVCSTLRCLSTCTLYSQHVRNIYCVHPNLSSIGNKDVCDCILPGLFHASRVTLSRGCLVPWPKESGSVYLALIVLSETYLAINAFKESTVTSHMCSTSASVDLKPSTWRVDQMMVMDLIGSSAGISAIPIPNPDENHPFAWSQDSDGFNR